MPTKKKWVRVEPEGGDYFTFKEGQSVEGVLTEKEENTGSRGNSTLYTMERVDGEVIKFWGSTILDDRMSPVQIGEEVMIEFTGWDKNQQGTEYKTWEVYRDAEVVEAQDDE